MAEVADFFNQMPPMTRYWFTGSLALPLLCRFGLISPYSVIFTSDFVTKLHIWRPLTAVLFYPISGNQGFHYLMNLYFLYNYSQRLEIGFFSGRPADYCFMLIFNWLALVGMAFAFSFVILMDPMIMSVLYVYCIINQDQVVSFWFGTRFKARYLPWALFGMNFLLGGGGITELAGIIVGHLYYFVMMKYPAEQGVQLLRTPQFLHDYFQTDRQAAGRPAGQAAPRPAASAGTGTPTASTFTTFRAAAASASGGARPPAQSPTSHHWGQGRRLED